MTLAEMITGPSWMTDCPICFQQSCQDLALRQKVLCSISVYGDANGFAVNRRGIPYQNASVVAGLRTSGQGFS